MLLLLLTARSILNGFQFTALFSLWQDFM